MMSAPRFARTAGLAVLALGDPLTRGAWVMAHGARERSQARNA
jgi:hypothetical protein